MKSCFGCEASANETGRAGEARDSGSRDVFAWPTLPQSTIINRQVPLTHSATSCSKILKEKNFTGGNRGNGGASRGTISPLLSSPLVFSGLVSCVSKSCVFSTPSVCSCSKILLLFSLFFSPPAPFCGHSSSSHFPLSAFRLPLSALPPTSSPPLIARHFPLFPDLRPPTSDL